MFTKTIEYTDLIKKVLPILIGAAFMVGFIVPLESAHAQTTGDLEAQITQLMAQIKALQNQLSVQNAGVCPYTWTRSLGVGSSGMDVKRLQQFLNSSQDTQLAASGPGSPGQETLYYGPITAQAVAIFQAKYRSEILTPLGLFNPTGYFGPSTMVKANVLCTQVATTPSSNTGGGNNTGQPTDNQVLTGGEAFLDNYDARTGDDTTAYEGENYARVLDGSFRVNDGDIRVDRIDVAVDPASGNDESRPWNTFEDVSIWVNGEKIAEKNVSSRSAWSENTPNSGDYRVRIGGLDNWIVREGDTANFTIAFSLANGIVDRGHTDTWDVFIPHDGIRAIDGAAVNQYIGDTNDAVSLDIEGAGANDELIVRTSSSDPVASTLRVESDKRSDWFTVFAFGLDTQDSTNDITITEIPVGVTLSTSTYDARVNDAELVVNGQRYTDYTVTGGNSKKAELTFDINYGDLTINAGDRETAKLMLRFNSLPSAYEGTTIYATSTSDNIAAEGADDLTGSQLSGAATGDVHTLRTHGVMQDLTNTSATVQRAQFAGDQDLGTFSIKFDVTAFEGDVYIPRSAASGTTLGTAGVNYIVQDSSGNQVSTGTSTAALSSNATIDGSYYRVAEGQTKTFTLKVTYNPLTSNFYRVQLYSINFNDAKAAPDTQQRALPASSYETDVVDISG